MENINKTVGKTTPESIGATEMQITKKKKEFYLVCSTNELQKLLDESKEDSVIVLRTVEPFPKRFPGQLQEKTLYERIQKNIELHKQLKQFKKQCKKSPPWEVHQTQEGIIANEEYEAEHEDTTKYGKYVAKLCTLEPQMGKCKWNYSYKHKKFMCSICGKEFSDGKNEEIKVEEDN